MKINWKVRLKNPVFWVSLGSAILMAIGVRPESFVSWAIVWEAVLDLVSNPFALGCTIMTVWGVINDPTTKGFNDREVVLTQAKSEVDE